MQLLPHRVIVIISSQRSGSESGNRNEKKAGSFKDVMKHTFTEFKDRTWKSRVALLETICVFWHVGVKAW